MKTHFLFLSLCVLLAGCGGEQVQVQFVDAADPSIPAKLGISDQDWAEIKQLASRQKEFVIKDAGKAAPNVIEVEFKKPADTRNDQGGPAERYEKKDAGWAKQADFQSYWAVGKGRL